MLSEDQINSIRSSKNVVLAAFVVIEVIALYNWIVTPHLNFLQTAQRYEAVADKLAKKTRIIGTNVKLRRKKLGQLQEDFKHIHIKLFDPVKAKEFFSDIQAMAEQTDCIIYSLNFSPTDSAINAGQSEISSRITANRATFSVGGKYKDIIALINKLQNRSKQVWIDTISMEPVNRNSELLKCDMSIAIYVIYSEGKQFYG
jgi:hypothetical protein